MLTYHDAMQPETPEAGQAHRQKYMQWIKALGDKALVPMAPFGKCYAVSTEGLSETLPYPMMGYTLLDARDMQEALSLAQSCPFADIGTLYFATLEELCLAIW